MARRTAPTSRRRALALLGLAGTAAASGCARLLGSGSTGTPTDGPAGETPSPADTPTGERSRDEGAGTTESDAGAEPIEHVAITDVDPTAVQYNPFNPDHRPTLSAHLLFEPLARYSHLADDLLPAAARSWGVEDGAFVIDLREDLVWTDGAAVTAADLATGLKLARFVGDPIADWATAVRTPGEHRVAIDGARHRNPAMLARDVLVDRFVRTRRERYRPYLEHLEDGGGAQRLRSFADREPTTCGPFRLASRGEVVLTTERFADYPDPVGVDRFSLRLPSASGSAIRLLRSGEIDSHHALRPTAEMAARLPEGIETVRLPMLLGPGLVPNHDHRHLGDRAIRQAIASVVDRERAVAESYPTGTVPAPVPTGIAPSVQERWLGDEVGSFRTYGEDERRVDAAADVLTTAGYARRDGEWIGPDGEPVSVPIVGPPGVRDWTLLGREVVADLREFGFAASYDDPTDYRERLAAGDFDVAMANWLPGRPTPYPAASLAQQLWSPAVEDVAYRYPGASTAPSVGGDDAPITVPARDGAGETTVHPREGLDDLATATEPGAIVETVRDLAWVANVDLPMIPLASMVTHQLFDTREWAIDGALAENPNAHVARAAPWLVRTGELTHREG